MIRLLMVDILVVSIVTKIRILKQITTIPSTIRTSEQLYL